jgi:hypothetical protein
MRVPTAPPLIGLAVVLVVVGTGSASPERPAPADKARYTFGLWGDLPYDTAQEARVRDLTGDMNDAKLAFSVFDGDFKSGGTPCTDDAYTKAIERFNAFEAPVVYVPGDNEWTDCHRISNRGYNNLERLAHLRRVMFSGPSSFGRRTMALDPQSPGNPENRRFAYGDVLFITLNVPGSNNNEVNTAAECTTGSVRTKADCDADNAEFLARDAANRTWLRESFARARSAGAPGVVVIFQADPGFDLPETGVDERAQPSVDGFTPLLEALVAETRAFEGQVALVHGDTHYFSVDKPLVDQAHLLENFTRVETFGSPNVHWVQATVDIRNPNLFTFEARIVGPPRP